MDLLQELKSTSHKTGAAHETTTLKNVWSGRVPIYPKLMHKILGKVKINSFHSTNFEGLSGIKSVVGKKKSLSTFTALAKHSDMARGGGVQTKGGFILQLEGNLLASSTADIGSVPDESGRRWIHATTLEDYFGISFSDKGVFDKIKKSDKKWFELHTKYVDNYREKGGPSHITDQYPPLAQKEKAEYIKRWIDGWEKFLVKNKSKFIKHFGQEVKKQGTDPDKVHYGWNELVIYGIKIKDVFIISDNIGIDKKSKKEIMDAAKKVAGGKVIWGKQSGVAGFLKTRGGLVE